MLATTFSSVENLCKQSRPRSGPSERRQNVGPDMDPNRLALRIINFEKKADDNKSMNKYPGKELGWVRGYCSA